MPDAARRLRPRRPDSTEPPAWPPKNTISDGAHSPVYSNTWGEQIVEWLLAHPKPGHLID